MTTRGRVVVMGATAEEPPPGITTIAEAIDVAYGVTSEELREVLPGSDVLFAWRPRRGPLEEAWDRAGDLRWIQSASAGVDGLMFPGLVEGDVVLTNARGVFDEAIAEFVVGVLALFAKDLIGILDRQRRGEWLHEETERLASKRVLIVGVGPVGRAMARSCGALGMRVRGVGRTARTGDEAFGTIHGFDELTDSLPWADYVVDALPATPETRGAFGEEAFGAMNAWARFVNVGRGSTVDEAALVRALAEGRIAGAALDVFEEEPLPASSPLWSMANVVVSPHMSGDFAGWRETVVELFVENLERYLTGRPLRGVVDKRRGYVPS
ncbi:MAG TPA: D-2-hydroxyacid dehydrogenase [Actinomycetota bacterium]|nr:D-2-hydroxyacid dehydrogenase [Actinomycetota bacterium]